MSIHLDRAAQNDIVDLMIPFVTTEQKRQAFVRRVMFNHPAKSRVNFSEDGQTFAFNFMDILADETIDSKPALIVLLEEIRKQVGSEKQTQIDELMARLRMGGGSQNTPPQRSTPASEPKSQTISGLRGTNINIGGTQTIHGDQYINDEND